MIDSNWKNYYYQKMLILHGNIGILEVFFLNNAALCKRLTLKLA